MASKKTMQIAEQLGLSLKDIRDSLELSADIASEAVVKVLDSILKDLVSTSESGTLNGYAAIRIKTKSKTFRLRRANEVIPKGDYLWVVTVLPSENHQSLGLNVFNILDSGRERITGEGPYPMWGLSPQGNRRVPGGSTNIPGKRGKSIVQSSSELLSAIRAEPRSIPSQKKNDEDRLIFARGPIDSVDPLNLYERAFTIAKRKVTRLFPGVWNLVLVDDLEEVL